MTREVDVLLVGGGMASVRCARTLRRRGFEGSILLVGDEPMAPYTRPPLSKELLRGEVPESLIAAELETWYARHGVELLTNVAVTDLRPPERLAGLSTGETVRYGKCLLATGAEPVLPPIPGAEHALVLRTVVDARRVRERAVAAGAGAPAVVVGGGFIGVEVAASLATLGLRVTLLELTEALWAGSLGGAVSDWAVARLRAAGIEVRLGTAAGAVLPDGVRAGEELIPSVLTLAGVGVRPRTAVAEAAGLRVADGIIVDQARSAARGVFAAGDVARFPHPLADGGRIRVEHWHAAREGGERAALGMLGLEAPPPRAPWVFSEFAGAAVEVVGWAPDHDAEGVLGDPASDRFAVALLRGDRVAQLAVVNGFVPVEDARRFVEASPSASALRTLVPA